MQQTVQIRETDEGLIERTIPSGHILNYDEQDRDIVETYWCDHERKVIWRQDNRKWLYPHVVLNGLQPYMGEFADTEDDVLSINGGESYDLVDIIRNQNERARKRQHRVNGTGS